MEIQQDSEECGICTHWMASIDRNAEHILNEFKNGSYFFYSTQHKGLEQDSELWGSSPSFAPQVHRWELL